MPLLISGLVRPLSGLGIGPTYGPALCRPGVCHAPDQSIGRCKWYLKWLTWLAGAVELRNEIGRAVGTELPGTLVYDYPTISSIVAFLLPKTTAAAQQPDTQLSIPDQLR